VIRSSDLGLEILVQFLLLSFPERSSHIKTRQDIVDLLFEGEAHVAFKDMKDHDNVDDTKEANDQGRQNV